MGLWLVGVSATKSLLASDRAIRALRRQGTVSFGAPPHVPPSSATISRRRRTRLRRRVSRWPQHRRLTTPFRPIVSAGIVSPERPAAPLSGSDHAWAGHRPSTGDHRERMPRRRGERAQAQPPALGGDDRPDCWPEVRDPADRLDHAARPAPTARRRYLPRGGGLPGGRLAGVGAGSGAVADLRGARRWW